MPDRALNGWLWLRPGPRDLVHLEARRLRLVETGGPLFGYHDAGTATYVVTEAHGPGPNAKHRPRRFIPDDTETARLMREIHSRSDGALYYIGEWHTHPAGSHSPSRGDVRALSIRAGDPGLALPEPMMMIVPTAVLRRRIRIRPEGAYSWVREGRSVRRLTIGVTSEPPTRPSDWGP